MHRKVLLTRVLAAGLLVGCADAAAPGLFGPSFQPEFAIVPSVNPNGQFSTSGNVILKGFNPTNPHRGDAIVATFFFPATSNIITSVSDHLTDGTPVGNTYQLVDFVTAGGIAMATYVAVNVQNFPDPNLDANGQFDQNKVLVVQANLSTSIPRGGMTITAYSGVQPTFAQAVGPASHGSGSSDAQTTADPGAVSVAPNALVYAVTLANQVVGLDPPPPPFSNISNTSDGTTLKADAERMIQGGSAGTVHPTWIWGFNASAPGTHPGTWLASVFSLNEAPTSTNQPPTAAFTSSCSALTCAFTSTSSDPDGSIASYSWTFGDGGTSTVQNPSHSYAAGGTYTVTLTVTDNQGAASAPTSKTVTVTAPNQPPVASFTTSCSGLTCNFTSTSSDPDGTIASYRWTFGDGTAAVPTQNASHTYAAGGTYTVTLTVTDNRGVTNASSQSVTVSQPNQAPVVNAGPDQTAATGLLYSTSVSFSDANGNGPWSYRIDWGDGRTSTGTRTSQGSFTVGHTYFTILPRNFTIRVTVTDAAGASGSDTKVVKVLLL